MRLLVLTEGYPWKAPDGRFTMAGAFHQQHFQILAAEGLETTVVVPIPWVPPGLRSRNLKWRMYSDLPARQVDGDVTVLRPRYLAMPAENVRGVPDIFREFAVRRLGLRRPDIIQAYFAVPTGAAALRLARSWSVPYAVGMLGDDVNIYPAGSVRMRRLLEVVTREAGFAFANGSTLAATASELTGVSVPSLPIGAYAKRFEGLPSKAILREELGWPQDKRIALYVGAIVPTKGMEDLAQALSKIDAPNLLVVLVGDGPLSAALGALPNVRTEGARDASFVTRAMAAADMLVHPSHYEGLPTVLVEAGFAGLPIITTDAPGCIDLARDGRAVMLPVANPGALAAALVESVHAPEMLDHRRSLMLEHVREHYDLERNTRRLIAEYRRLTTIGPAPVGQMRGRR